MNFVLLALIAVNIAITIVLLTKKSASPTAVADSKLAETITPTLALHRDELRSTMTHNNTTIEERLGKFRESLDGNAQLTRQDAENGRTALEKSLKVSLGDVEEKIRLLTESNEKKQSELRETLRLELETLRKGNEEKLEKMRETVDEKLQKTLESRLGESFKQVSDKLEAVHKGLGEMQSLATGVGDLKRVLTNVKSRGGWGEVQLGRQLEDMLTREQYDMNVNIVPGSRDVVEYAIKLPGVTEGDVVYLPIDSKFPQEDYERLLLAQEGGNVDEMDAAGKEIEKAIKIQAKTISEKYIHPPQSTDFAIMYLPTEGLFAEVIRRPGLCYELQNTHHILVTGPTTLMAILNSLQMGFKTLKIQKSTSEVWKVLGEAKTEFNKYGKVWDKLEKQLSAAQNTVADAGRRSRALERKLSKVETLDVGGTTPILELTGLDLDEDEPEVDEAEEY